MLQRLAKELPYTPQSLNYFLRLRSAGGAVWLDSGTSDHPGRRFDVLAAAPRGLIFQGRDGLIVSGDLPASQPEDDVFSFVERHISKMPAMDSADHQSFNTGWIGYIGYDAGMPLHGLPTRGEDPHTGMGYYDWAIVQDHATQRTWLYAESQAAQVSAEQILAAEAENAGPFQLTEAFSSTSPAPSYQDQFSRLQGYITSGDCYQANLARHWSAAYQGDPLGAYIELRERFAGPYSAYIELGRHHILCLSPERFLMADRGTLQTKPIKGTRRRGTTPEEDTRLLQELATSTKDKAENLMIVDLLRNDLGQVCRTGSIHVPTLFGLETFANVHHLVSTVEGQLRTECTAMAALKACFPGGSITGAPKRRAMEIINELEPAPRGIYCGSIGYLDASGKMDMNIAIRTLACSQGRIHCWGGGGIVADSRCEAEYQEIEDKVGPLMSLLAASHT